MKLRLAAFNVENLFAFIDHYKNQDVLKLTEAEWQALSASVIPNKPLGKIKAVARAIEEIQPDILMLCEVGGLESLENLNRFFLHNAYMPQFLEGNSDRGIDIAYLVKRTLSLRYDLRSHRHRPIHFLYPHEDLSNVTGYTRADGSTYKSHKFSRDVLELRVFHEGEERPILVNLLVHLKSKWDRDGVDPGGRERRKAELDTVVEIYRELQAEFAGQVPILISGDFNGQAACKATDAEFARLYADTDLEDCLELHQVPEGERVTYVQVTNGVKPLPMQLDYIFAPKALQNRMLPQGTFVFRFKDEWGIPYPLPLSMQIKRELPSDHYPIVTTLNLDD